MHTEGFGERHPERDGEHLHDDKRHDEGDGLPAGSSFWRLPARGR